MRNSGSDVSVSIPDRDLCKFQHSNCLPFEKHPFAFQSLIGICVSFNCILDFNSVINSQVSIPDRDLCKFQPSPSPLDSAFL